MKPRTLFSMMRNLLVCVVLMVLFVACDDGNPKNMLPPIKQQDTAEVSPAAYTVPMLSASYTEDDILFMKQLGMTNSATFKKHIRLVDRRSDSNYFAKYGLHYMSNEYIAAFMKEHELLLGSLSDYKYTIPAQSLKDFRYSYNKLLATGEFDYYFLRYSLRASATPGAFIARVDESDLLPGYETLIQAGPSLRNGQYDQQNSSLLSKKALATYGKLYPRKHEFVVDHYSAMSIKVMAQSEYFNLDGKQVVDNKIMSRDPAILLEVEGGYLILAAWK